ncbi:MAG: FHA domain-containing protein [Janthinobacterium lividum]
MSLQAKTYLNLLAGALAGFLAWVLTDLTGWFADIFQPHYVVREGLFNDPKYLFYGVIFGLLLGLLLALVDSLSLETHRRQVQVLTLGAGIGALAGWIGLALGQMVYSSIYKLTGLPPDASPATPGQFFVLLVGRAFGYALIGCIVGTAQGIVNRSAVIARQGAFGGLIGGFLGGAVYQIANGLGFPSSFSRLLALAATGALAGFFVGLVQNILKQAWIRVVLGRNEGKEYLISKPVTTIGRSELADIGLFGDPSIAPTHAAIESLPAQNRHRLRAVMEAGKRGAEYAPPLVNGQPVAGEQWLVDGDTLQIGKRTLLFQEKATRKGSVSAPPAPRPAFSAGEGGSAPPSRYIGEELASEPAQRPSLTTPADVIDQMGATPTGEATVLSLPGMGEAGTRLVCIQGPYAGQSFPLTHAPAVIGRAPERDISLPADTSISRSHARITYADGRHFIADEGSSNGTFVNGGRVADPRPLSSGDTIQLADTAFRYE